MSNSVYTINKGINKSIEFKGLKAQYIWYLGGGIIALLILFAIMYIISNKYGEHGMMKAMAKRNVPKVLKSYNRKAFLKMNKM